MEYKLNDKQEAFMGEIDKNQTSSEDINSSNSKQSSVEGSELEQKVNDASAEPKKNYYRPPYSRYTNSR